MEVTFPICNFCLLNIGEAIKLCNEVEAVSEFTYIGYWVRAGGSCKAAVTAAMKFGLVKLRECGDL